MYGIVESSKNVCRSTISSGPAHFVNSQPCPGCASPCYTTGKPPEVCIGYQSTGNSGRRVRPVPNGISRRHELIDVGRVHLPVLGFVPFDVPFRAYYFPVAVRRIESISGDTSPFPLPRNLADAVVSKTGRLRPYSCI
uniref:Uncharacterized protein n=1 Tax=Arundo donax TaxID=35708 RepID=A0A0A9HAF4_ARUDO